MIRKLDSVGVASHVRETLNKIRSAQRNAMGTRAQEEPIYELLVEFMQWVKSEGIEEIESLILDQV